MITLNDLLKVPEQERKFSWDEKFFKLFSETTVRLLSKDPQQGPDGWPYLVCETQQNSSSNDQVKNYENDDIESTQKIFQWLAEKGIGLIVNPRREPYPDYVFSYGMIWNFRQTGYFIQPNDENKTEQKATEIIYDNKKISCGPPSVEYLPNHARKILKDFFRDQSVLNPKILMISQDKKSYDLCFSLESLGNPIASEHAGVAEAIAWFLPTHYSIVLISESGLPEFLSL